MHWSRAAAAAAAAGERRHGSSSSSPPSSSSDSGTSSSETESSSSSEEAHSSEPKEGIGGGSDSRLVISGAAAEEDGGPAWEAGGSEGSDGSQVSSWGVAVPLMHAWDAGRDQFDLPSPCMHGCMACKSSAVADARRAAHAAPAQLPAWPLVQDEFEVDIGELGSMLQRGDGEESGSGGLPPGMLERLRLMLAMQSVGPPRPPVQRPPLLPSFDSQGVAELIRSGE